MTNELMEIKDADNTVIPDMISNLTSMAPAYIYAQSTTITVPNLPTR